MCKYSKLNLNTFALSCCIAARWCTLSYCAEKKQSCIINVFSKVRFTENIEIQPELDPLFNFWIPVSYCKSQTPPLCLTQCYFGSGDQCTCQMASHFVERYVAECTSETDNIQTYRRTDHDTVTSVAIDEIAFSDAAKNRQVK